MASCCIWVGSPSIRGSPSASSRLTSAFFGINPRAYEIFGRPPEEGPVQDEELFGQALHPDDHDAVWEVWTGARRLLGVIADITERRRLEERLREAERLESIGVLARGVAHDFNNLLTGIMGNSSLALETLEPSHPAYGMIDCVLEASDRAAALIRQLLAYSGRGRFVLESIDLSSFMNTFKSYAGRGLNRLGNDAPDQKRWARRGSTRWLWKDADVLEAIRYVVLRQGDPMEVYLRDQL